MLYTIYVQVLTQEKAQLLKEAAHAQNVQQLYEKVKNQTHEVQLESQRVLRAVELQGSRQHDINRKVAAPPPELKAKRAPASARQHPSARS
jgi:predicted nucleic acid-binding protein|tara:strand:+ start:212 stop:484 length:273 start_codon:yes stop_codon:yes gene_type:complete